MRCPQAANPAHFAQHLLCLAPPACGAVAARFVRFALPLSPAGGGQQNGAVDAPPLRLLLRGRCAGCCLRCGRYAVCVCGVVRQAAPSFDAGEAALPPHPRLCAVAAVPPPRIVLLPRPPRPVSRCGVALRCSFPAPSACPPVRPGGAPSKSTPRLNKKPLALRVCAKAKCASGKHSGAPLLVGRTAHSSKTRVGKIFFA